VHLKPLLKRGALLALANWPMVAAQFLVETTFQVVVLVPIVGAAVLFAAALGTDFGGFLSGDLGEVITRTSSALLAEPVALAALVAAVVVALLGGSAVTFLVKGGLVEVMLTAEREVGAIETAPLSMTAMIGASRFTLARFMTGCARLFPSYLALGSILMLVYGLSAAAYLALAIYGYPSVGDRGPLIRWGLTLAASGVGLVAWITVVNLVYLLTQVAIAVEGVGLWSAVRAVSRFVAADWRTLGRVLVVFLVMIVGGTVAAALASSAAGLVGFIPLVGLAAFPLQLVAQALRGLVFAFIGLTSITTYVTLFRRHVEARASAAVGSRVPAFSVDVSTER
jgi:hypothetical protein